MYHNHSRIFAENVVIPDVPLHYQSHQSPSSTIYDSHLYTQSRASHVLKTCKYYFHSLDLLLSIIFDSNPSFSPAPAPDLPGDRYETSSVFPEVPKHLKVPFSYFNCSSR